MKSLYSCILESARIGQLPFTLDELKAAESAILAGDDDIDVFRNIIDKVKAKYGPKFEYVCVSIFTDCYSALKYEGMTIEQLYQNLQQLSQKKVDRLMGAGSSGVVFDLGDKVVKFHFRKAEKWDMAFYKYCQDHPDPALPTIYKFTDKYVVMEKLDASTPKCALYEDQIYEKLPVNCYMPWWHMATGFKYYEAWNTKEKNALKAAKKYASTVKLNKQQQEIADWVAKVADVLNECGVAPMSDVRQANMGERPNGEIVIFDI